MKNIQFKNILFVLSLVLILAGAGCENGNLPQGGDDNKSNDAEEQTLKEEKKNGEEVAENKAQEDDSRVESEDEIENEVEDENEDEDEGEDDNKIVSVPTATPAPTQTLTPTPKPTATVTPTPTQTVKPQIVYNLAEVAKHKTEQDCWTVVSGKVYNITTYIPKHPGGKQTIMQGCGTDGTSLFDSKHSEETKQFLKPYYLADLVK